VTEYDALREESARLVAVDDREGWAKVVERMDRIARRRVEEEPAEEAELTLGLAAETRTGVRNLGTMTPRTRGSDAYQSADTLGNAVGTAEPSSGGVPCLEGSAP
jgi:hypothetical protein